MKPYELYNELNDTDYTTSGDYVDWCVKVYKDEKKIRLLFQGSENIENRNGLRDWINNFNFPVKIYRKQKSCIKVARGWGKAYKSCNDIVMKKLIDTFFEFTDYRIEICGYSYGGAVAQIAVEDLYYRTGIKAGLVTFGAPKSLWGIKTKNYVKKCCSEIKQYAHKDDIVTKVPPFPFYFNLKKTKLGKGLSNPVNWFKPFTYHCIYGNPEIYGGINE